MGIYEREWKDLYESLVEKYRLEQAQSLYYKDRYQTTHERCGELLERAQRAEAELEATKEALETSLRILGEHHPATNQLMKTLVFGR